MPGLFKFDLFFKLVICASILILSDCATKQTVTCGKISCEKTGWIDENTFRITAKGTVSSEVTDTEKRKEESLKNAINNAQKASQDIFSSYYVEGSGIQDYPNRRYEFRALISRITGMGKAIIIEYDKGQNCDILFEIKQDQLKKRVTQFF